MRRLPLILLFLMVLVHSLSAQNRINGRVISGNEGLPIDYALIKVGENPALSTVSDSAGRFSFIISRFPVVLEVSHVGYLPSTYLLSHVPSGTVEIQLMEATSELDDFVVSTGYEKIPRERVTGSFAQVSNQLFNRRVSPDVISRLEDAVPGLVFNRRNGTNNISIRGRNTITGDGRPLIVVDNFPFEGDLASLNPNDIENVSVLKDAAASSIWGARAGNGVIVITTKKGGFKQKPSVSFNTNYTIMEAPDLYYQPQMKVSDFIDWEQQLFQTGFYNSYENSPTKVGFSPVVELLFKKRDGLISDSEADAGIMSLKRNDVRRDMEKYLYQKGRNQQYAVALSGGDASQKYSVSLGYDKQLASLVGNNNDRFTLNANHTYRLAGNKLELSTGIFFGSQDLSRNGSEPLTYIGTHNSRNLYPYARLADDSGRPLNVVKNHRMEFAEAALIHGLYDWTHSPIQELSFSDKSSHIAETRLQSSLSYQLIPGLRAELSYLYQNSNSSIRDYYSTDTYYTRNLINTYTQVDSRGNLSRPVPYGGILDRNSRRVYGNSVRGQVNYNRQIGRGRLDIMAGSEIRDHRTEAAAYRWYGYDDLYATSLPVDYNSNFTSYVNPRGGAIRIPANQGQSYLIDRFVSYYINGAYRWREKYILSGSARLDQSNLFGVRANQKGVPLWSAGFAWVLSEESFLKDRKSPYLKLRATLGSSGNINKSLSAQTTANFSPRDNLSLLPYATIQNPPNASLQWEKVKMLNVGVDFEAFKSRLSGSFEYYTKRAYDLFGQIPYAPSTGINQFSGNTSASIGHGIDFNVNLKVLEKPLQWRVFTLFSYVTDKVTDSKVQYPASLFLAAGDRSTYVLEGKPQYAIYSYDFAGLNSQTGDPMGYLDGEPSTDWSKIITTTTAQTLRFHGTVRPLVFGAVRNDLEWKRFSISVNVSYRLGYYFRRSSVNYSSLWTGSTTHADYEDRWQKPGDEMHTSVPSDPGGANSQRNSFYSNSSALVEKGDHIRLQDVRVSYSLPEGWVKQKGKVKGEFYAYANNLGILWKATKTSLDPDFPDSTFPPTRSIGFGLRLTL
jgi:TonB-linked SusC/RagA family outer membrane protein